MSTKNEIGRIGEDIACGYLGGKGYRILERNSRTTFGELDVIAISPHKTLVFIEVKTMVISRVFNTRLPEGYPHSSGTLPDFIKPEDQLSSSKLNKFRKISEWYANKYPKLSAHGYRLDALCIDLSKNRELIEIRHYEGI